MDLVPYLIWGIISALFGGFVAIALNRWAAGWGFRARVLVAIAASTFPIFVMVVGVGVPFSMSLDEFLIPFALQILLSLVVSTPVVWLVSRRGTRQPVLTDVFD